MFARKIVLRHHIFRVVQKSLATFFLHWMSSVEWCFQSISYNQRWISRCHFINPVMSCAFSVLIAWMYYCTSFVILISKFPKMYRRDTENKFEKENVLDQIPFLFLTNMVALPKFICHTLLAFFLRKCCSGYWTWR